MYFCVLNSGVDRCGHLIEHNVIMRFANCHVVRSAVFLLPVTAYHKHVTNQTATSSVLRFCANSSSLCAKIWAPKMILLFSASSVYPIAVVTMVMYTSRPPPGSNEVEGGDGRGTFCRFKFR